MRGFGRLNSIMSSMATNLSGKSNEVLFTESQQLEARGQNRLALVCAREIVKRKPAWAHGHYAVGSALCGLGLLDEADASLRKAISRDPNQAGIYARHAEVLNRLGHHEQAIETIEQAVRLSPNDPRILVVKAMVLRLGGDLENAYACLDGAIVNGSNDPNLRSVHATIAGQIGKREQGIADLEKLVEEADTKVWTDRFMHSAILMHLSRMYDQAGRFDDAFACAQRAGEMRQTGYDPDRYDMLCADRLRVWTKETIGALPRSRVDSDKPVFILGMPRSGTSLIEQIIASHPSGYGSGELRETYVSCEELGEPNELVHDRMDVVTQLKKPTLDRYARKILKAMEKNAGKDATRITDKLPNNYEHVGMIGLLFPNAKIIHCKRSALDTCISCYLLDFVGDRNHGYSYDLSHMACQYLIYERYMAHWKQVSPIEMLEVEYEELVANPVEGAKQIIEYVGLEWNDQCASSHKTKRAVSTLSSDQVRKPVYTSSIGRWKNYESHIGALIEGLGKRD